jgi:hypothetical protein
MQNAISNDALSSRSGGIDDRPIVEYMLSNTDDRSLSAASAIAFTARSGCFGGTRSPASGGSARSLAWCRRRACRTNYTARSVMSISLGLIDVITLL